MLGRQVRVTYAHKRKRIRNKNNKSSPLETLPPETDDLTLTQMARRMLKRSRRAAFAEQLEDKNVEHIRQHLAKRIKRNQERVSHIESVGAPFDIALQDDGSLQTPFHAPCPVHEQAASRPFPTEQLSLVPATKRVASRTRSRNLKENSAPCHHLASPFHSRPGSAAPSPKHKNRGRTPHRDSRNSLHAKSRTLSGVFKTTDRHISRKSSAVSLEDTNGRTHTKYTKHHWYPSSLSAPYMRSQLEQEDCIAPPKTYSRIFDDYNILSSPEGAIRGDASFYTGQPQSCSTPVTSRSKKNNVRENRAPPWRQTIHISGNSIFSSSDEFTIGSLPAVDDGEIIASRNNIGTQNQWSGRIVSPCPKGSQMGCISAGSYVAEYEVPLYDIPSSPASTTATKVPGKEGIPIEEGLFGLPGTSPAHGKSPVFRTRKKLGALTPSESPSRTTPHCPPSPASDLAQEFGSMDICGDYLDAQSDRETRHPSDPIPLSMRSHSLQGCLGNAEPTMRKFVKRMPARNRAGTIRASDFVKPGPAPPAGSLLRATVSSLSSVRRTRSGTVVGPDSKLANKATRTKSTGLATVQSGPESESDDELLLKAAWVEDMLYLGLAVPLGEDAEPDELNLGGPWPKLAHRPEPRRR